VEGQAVSPVETPDDTAGRFVEHLVDAVPWWDNIWRQHQTDFGGQAPQAFLRTVAMMTAARIGGGAADVDGRAPDGLPISATLDYLESALTAAKNANDPDVEALVGDSFVARLPSADVVGADVAPFLGPALSADLAHRRATGPAVTPARTLIPDLAAANPAMAGVLDSHIADWDELLPTTYFADLVRACVRWLGSGEAPHRESVASVLGDLDTAYGNDVEVDELISTGFVENLPYPDEEGAGMLAMLGPKLRAEYNLERPGHQL
jgi:hypothetical protein